MCVQSGTATLGRPAEVRGRPGNRKAKRKFDGSAVLPVQASWPERAPRSALGGKALGLAQVSKGGHAL